MPALVRTIAFAAAALALFSVTAGADMESASRAATQECVPQQGAGAAADLKDTEIANPAEAVLAAYLAKRFAIAEELTGRVVQASHAAAGEVGLDPLLLLAVISVESRFNPFAQSPTGARGLMQIIPKFHLDTLEDLGGEDGVLDPESNILAGARILKQYIRRAGGLEAGLQVYNGAQSDDSTQYAQKVLAEKDRIAAAMRAAPRTAIAAQ